jgi:hypothetical protein
MADCGSFNVDAVKTEQRLQPAWREVLLLGLCAAVCSVQIFWPPFIGLANNGDFGRVFARFAISPPDVGERNFIYFVSGYDYGDQYLWKSDFKSSENLLAAPPILLAKALGARTFDIRWLGGLHLTLFLGAGWSLLLYLRRFGPAMQLVLGTFCLCIFTDVAYVSYFNSFFTDTAALLGLLLMIPLALHLTEQEPARTATIWLFAAAALLFVTSKSQHALLAVFPAALLLSLRPQRQTVAAAAVILGGAAYMFATTAEFYPTQTMFNAIFFKLAPNSPAPQAAVREVGLGADEYRYIGTHAFSAGNPFSDLAWMRSFNDRTGYGKIVGYWVRHPAEALKALAGDLRENAPNLRQANLANYRREDGFPPGTLTRRFASWSGLRSTIYQWWPWHMVVWYAAVIAGAAANLKKHRRPAAICLGICIMGAVEFCFASLTEATETERHLFIFHVLTEITFCFAAAWAVINFRSASSRRDRLPTFRRALSSNPA